ELELADDMTGQRQLERAFDTREMALNLWQHNHCPPEVPHDLPVVEVAPGHPPARSLFIRRNEIFQACNAADLEIGPREAPVADTSPADVLQRIAVGRKFPIEHASETTVMDKVVAGTIVAMDERGLLMLGHVELAPPQSPFEHRVGTVERVQVRAVSSDIVARQRSRQEAKIGMR